MGGGVVGWDRHGGRPARRAGNGKSCSLVLYFAALGRSEGAVRPRTQAGRSQVEGLKPEDGAAEETARSETGEQHG